MVTKTRLDKAITGLKKILERHQDFKSIKIDKNQISIDNDKSEYWGTILYITVVLLVPTILMIFEIAKTNRPYYSLIVLIAFLLLFGRDLYKMVKSNVCLQINFKDNNLNVENNNGIFKKCFPKQTISFDEISKVEIVDKAVHSKYSATRWKEVTMFNKDKQKFNLASFDEKYPDSFIAQKVKFLFDVIIWTEKNSKGIN
ncbi:MAG: hypothetical protein JSR97_05355 [Verrucomicrobia bacterium]|nr:hypothetical protein [Verrucomicrobiota bacterium]